MDGEWVAFDEATLSSGTACSNIFFNLRFCSAWGKLTSFLSILSITVGDGKGSFPLYRKANGVPIEPRRPGFACVRPFYFGTVGDPELVEGSFAGLPRGVPPR